MKIKMLLILIILIMFILPGCTREDEKEPSEIKEIEISEPSFDLKAVTITPENFMEKMAYLGVEVGRVEDEGGTGGFPELVYEGYSEFPEGDIYGSFVTYQEEDMATQWFSQVRLDYGDMGMGVDDVVDEDKVFSIYTEAYFIGVIREDRTILIITATKDPSLAKQVFSCFLPNAETL